jgi:hypothetical protein
VAIITYKLLFHPEKTSLVVILPIARHFERKLKLLEAIERKPQRIEKLKRALLTVQPTSC